MSKRPLYMKDRRHSWIWLVLLLIGGIYALCAYRAHAPLQMLVENSELKGHSFSGQVEEITASASGLKAYFMMGAETPLVSMSFIFDKAGSAYDEEGKEGLAKMAAATLTAGAGKQSAEALADESGIKGIKISFSVDKDTLSGNLTMPAKFLEDGGEMLHRVLTAPRFEGKYVDNARAAFLKLLESEKENPSQELALAFQKLVYGTHPYGRNPKGTKTSLEALSRSDLQSFVKKHLGQSNLFVGISGNLTKEQAETLVDTVFGGLPKEAEILEIEVPVLNLTKPALTIDRTVGQNITAYATKGTCRKCDDFYPLYIANYLFGGAGLTSRVNQSLREKEGLTYGGYSSLVLNDKANLLTAGFSATPDKYAQAEKLFADEWQKAAKGFSEEELQQAKNYLTASYNLRFASTAGIAEMLAYMQKYDLGLDFLIKRNSYVEGVTLKQLNETAYTYFSQPLLQAKTGLFNKEKTNVRIKQEN